MKEVCTPGHWLSKHLTRREGEGKGREREKGEEGKEKGEEGRGGREACGPCFGTEQGTRRFFSRRH